MDPLAATSNHLIDMQQDTNSTGKTLTNYLIISSLVPKSWTAGLQLHKGYQKVLQIPFWSTAHKQLHIKTICSPK
jgi:hypothetical protein